MCEETPCWALFTPHPLTAGSIQYKLKGKIEQVFLNKAFPLYQWGPVSSMPTSNNVSGLAFSESCPPGGELFMLMFHFKFSF